MCFCEVSHLVDVSKDKTEELVADVIERSLTHMLMFNGGKTDVLLIHS